ncbi:hypothetical protein Tco_0559371 [Tanacetum coccineum]
MDNFYSTVKIEIKHGLDIDLESTKRHKYQKLLNSIKATRTQHKKELDELIEHVNQKTHAYADVRAQNQDLLMTISEHKNKLKTVDKGKNVNTKFDKSETLGTLLCVTPLPKNIAVEAKKVSNTKVNADRSNPVPLNSIPKMSVECSNSVRRPKSKDTKSKDRVLKNTNDNRPFSHVQKTSGSVSIDSNKRETMHSNVCQSNASVLNTKTVNAVNDDSNVERALFTTAIAAKSKNLRANSIVAKSRLSVAKTPKTTNKVSSVLPLSPDSSQSRTLSNYMKTKLQQVEIGRNGLKTNNVLIGHPIAKLINDSLVKQRVVPMFNLNLTHRLPLRNGGYSKHMTGNLSLLRNFVEKFMGTVRFRNDHFTAITRYGDCV